MLSQVLGSCERLGNMATASLRWTKFRVPGLSAAVVDFSFMPLIVTSRTKALVLLTTGLETFVGSLMSVHMLADSIVSFEGWGPFETSEYILPFRWKAESRRIVFAVSVLTDNVSLAVSWRLLVWSNRGATAMEIAFWKRLIVHLELWNVVIFLRFENNVPG
jgi:hypothetical protein